MVEAGSQVQHVALRLLDFSAEHEVAVKHLAKIGKSAFELCTVCFHGFAAQCPLCASCCVGLVLNAGFQRRQCLFERLAANLG
jgi:hypothetical protein